MLTKYDMNSNNTGRVLNYIRTSSEPATHIQIADRTTLDLGDVIDAIDVLLEMGLIEHVELCRVRYSHGPVVSIPIQYSAAKCTGNDIVLPSTIARDIAYLLGSIKDEGILFGSISEVPDGIVVDNVSIPEQESSIGELSVTTDGVMMVYDELGDIGYTIHTHLHNPEPSDADYRTWVEIHENGVDPLAVTVLDKIGRNISYIYRDGTRYDASLVISGEPTIEIPYGLVELRSNRVISVLYGYKVMEE